VRRFAPVLVALGAVGVVLLAYLALGGASYTPTPVADPCQKRDWRHPGALDEVLEQVVLSALDGAACELGVSREALVLALRDDASLAAFSREEGITRDQAGDAVQRGLVRAVDDAEDAGVLPGFVAGLVRGAAERIPPWLLLDVLERLRGLVS
jgi:hypothetical protein